VELTSKTLLRQFSQLCQLNSFPVLEEETGELSVHGRLLAEALSLTQLHRFVHKQLRGQPCDDRCALIAAFLAKSIHNFPTTRQLIDRLKADPQLRSICGWMSEAAVPSEMTFSRAFADFARRKLPERIHEALVRLTQQKRIARHIARDSPAIEACETFPETHSQKRAHKTGKGQ
jgi:transposase